MNHHLVALEYWCLQRARNVVQDYVRLTGGSVNGCEGQDFELESIVEYYRPLTLEEDQDEKEGHDGLILRTDFFTLQAVKFYFLKPTPDAAAAIFESLYYNWYDGVEGIPGLNNQRICWSFHDLHDHHDLTWDQILQIETVWIDVKAIHQLATSIGRPSGTAIEHR
ncbi:hypothetical protein TU87_02515 [Pseudomonas weihenstephanensis]|nr:hypothetical protein TU87_02515 [Pseudomonas weihenstephanensis]